MLLASMFCDCICILPIFLYWTSLTRPLLSLALSRMANRIACKSYSCNSDTVRPTENQPNVVLPDRERATARVKTHVHWKSSQKDSQRSLSSRFTVCAVYSTTVFSPLSLACEYRDNGSTAVQGTVARSARAFPLNLTLQPVCSQEICPLGKARAKLTQIKQAWGPPAEGHSSCQRPASGSYLRHSSSPKNRSRESLASTQPWVSPTRLERESPMTICVCYCISYCISLFHSLLSVSLSARFFRSVRFRKPALSFFFFFNVRVFIKE